MSFEVSSNESQLSIYLPINQSFANNSNTTTQTVIDFKLFEIYTIVITFLLGLLVNITLILSLLRTVKTSNQDFHRRGAHKFPVIDLILLILLITSFTRLLVRSGLQVLCISGNNVFSNF